MKSNQKDKDTLSAINIRIFIVIIAIAIFLSVSGLTAGAVFLAQGISIAKLVILIGVIMLVSSAVAALLAVNMLKHPYHEVDRLRREAEAMSISKTAFLANMSHEIRTPMNSIIGFSELALDGETSLKTRDYLNKIRTNAEWMLQIVNDILDISRVEYGKMELENIPFDLHELFTSCRTLIMPKAVEKGISLYFYVEPSVGKRPLGDPTKLRQVLVNLLSNAVKFTNNGMVKLQAALKDMNEETITMYFEVKDSGVGMTGDQIERIFSPFSQTESGSMVQYGVSGLGLTITKTIVDLMGGKLAVESTPGIGSKFSFELTFETIDNADEEMLEEKIVFNDIERPVFEGEVLLCEDSPMNQQIICEHLSRVGIKTIVADNGRIGLDMVKTRKEKGRKQFDLIFMDIHMPVMDGLEAAAKIMDLNTSIPIVAITANIMANDRDIYRMNGIFDCVGKPFTSHQLWRCLMKYFTPISTGEGQKNHTIESDMEFQKSLQILFVKNNRTKYEEIASALELNDIQLAHRLVHSLKGNAGQVGKTILQRAAANVESMLKDGKNRVTHEHLQILKTELNMVINDFSPLLNEDDDQSTFDNTLDSSDVQKLFDRLEDLLKKGNPECIHYKNDIRIIPGDDNLKNQLIKTMEDFEFLSALAVLEEIRKKVG